MKFITLVAACLAMAIAVVAGNAQAADLPKDSVYQLPLDLVDQDARALQFAGLRGKPRVVSMFYASCPFMCPLIIDTLRLTEARLDAAQRDRLGVLMVSFDSKRDSPDALKALAAQRKINTSRWTLARAEAPAVRKLSAMLGIQYRELDNGEFSHSSVLILLDAEGRIVARTEVMGKVDPEFLASVEKVLGER